MELTHYHIDQTFDFKGSFDMPSRCGLKISQKGEQTVVIVTELYKENRDNHYFSNLLLSGTDL